jgi:tRNA(Ile)-lysidine synthase
VPRPRRKASKPGRGADATRPWLGQPRAHIEAYVRRHRLRHVHDPSNDDPRFARNRLRQAAWASLDGAFPMAEAALATAARRAADEAEALAELARLDASTVLDAEGALLKSAWLALSASRRTLVLRLVLEGWTGQGASETLVRRLADELPRCPSGRWPAPGGGLWLRGGRLRYAAEGSHGPA